MLIRMILCVSVIQNVGVTQHAGVMQHCDHMSVMHLKGCTCVMQIVMQQLSDIVIQVVSTDASWWWWY